MKNFNSVFAALALIFFSSFTYAENSTENGSMGGYPTQTTTNTSGNSASQQSTISTKPTSSGYSGYVGSTTTVNGGYSTGGQGQPIPNNNNGSSSTTTYQIGIKKNF
jgi:hypothetical protein